MANTLKFGNGQWATGNGTALAYNDENANFKPLPFDFTRASSGTTVNQSGLIETVGSGIPRIDFQGNTKGALLLEPSRTNLVNYSKAFDNSYWIKSGASVVGGFASPSADSPLGAFKLVFDGSDNFFYSSVSNTIDTSTIYIKGIKDETIKFGKGSNVSVGSLFTLSGEWQRLEYYNSTTSDYLLTLSTYSGATAREVYIFGAQVEVGSYPTSYIPTSGSDVTRVAETSSQTVPDGVIGQTEGTVFLDSKMALQSINNYQLFSINNGGGSDRIRILTATANRLRFIYQLDGGSTAYSFYNPTDYGSLTSLKIAFTYKSGDIKVYINGVLVDSSSNTFTIAETLTNIDIASSAGGYSQMFFNDVKLYNTALTDAQLIALTQV